MKKLKKKKTIGKVFNALVLKWFYRNMLAFFILNEIYIYFNDR